MASPKTPKNDQEALTLLREADTSTKDGLAQIETVMRWVEGRTNVPAELRSEVADANAALTRAYVAGRFQGNEELSEGLEQVRRIAARVTEVLSGSSPGNPEADAFAVENLTARRTEPASSTGSRPRPVEDRARGLSADAVAARQGISPGTGNVQPGTGTQVEGGEDFAARLPQDILGGPTAFDPTSPGGAGLVGPGGQAGTQFLPSRTQAYYDGDETQILDRMPTEQRARVQDLLVATGLASSVVPGELDTKTLSGFQELLAISNRNREDWRVTVDRLTRAVDRGEIGDGADGSGGRSVAEIPGYVPPPQLQPDPARLRVSARNFAEQELGRELDEDEIDYLTAALEDVEQQNYSRMVAADRAEFDARQQATVTGLDQTPTALPEYGDDVVASRFRELFEQKYANEIDMRGRVEVGRTVSELVGRGAGTVAQMTGGR